MHNEEIINNLVDARRAADLAFAAAQLGDEKMRIFEFARIIGQLQGSITGAAIDLGFRGSIRKEKA